MPRFITTSINDFMAFAALGLFAAGGAFVALDSRNSDPGGIFLFILLGVPLLIFSFIAGARGFKQALGGKQTSRLPFAFGLLAVSVITYEVVHRSIAPSHIEWNFSYPGQTGSYHKVEFRFFSQGQWREGPSVEGWPMICRFPDLNDDGFSDIQVFESREGPETGIEFIYLPDNDGKVFWEGIKHPTRLAAGYEQAGFWVNYP